MSEKIIISRDDLLALINQCTAFIKTVDQWDSTVQVSAQDSQWLNDRLAELKDLFKKAEDIKIIKIQKLHRGVWPGFDAVINDNKELFSKIAPVPTGSKHCPFTKGETFQIPAGNLPRFFEGCARFIRNQAENLTESRSLRCRHSLLVAHDLGDPRLFSADPNYPRYKIV
jgi:hypothetical protein